MEILKNVLEYMSIIISVVMLVKIINSQLKYYQQSHYHFSSFSKNFKYYYFKDKTNFLLPLIPIIFYSDLWYIQIVYIIYLFILLSFKFRKKDIIKLKYTARIKRLYFLIFVSKIIIASLLLFLFELPQLISALVILILVSPLILLISSLIVYPIEYLISKNFQRKAKKKLRIYQTKVIGITGSYGKTSTKNFLFSMMKEKYITLATEKSYNTINGVSKNINELLTSYHQFMIVEMGASHKNDIKKLVSLATPMYGIVTEVGPQHLETFKSIKNILNEKMKLIDALPEDGIGIINGDNPYIREYEIQSKCKIITFGMGSNCDYCGEIIKVGIDGILFKVKYDDNELELRTNLLGKHNIYNILACFALAIELGVPLKEIIYQISNLEQVPHRLSVEKVSGFTLIDDAFNSNLVGFNNALEILNEAETKKILITPGIVEAGELEEKINYELAEKISQVCDFVILIKTKSSAYIKKGLIDLGYKDVIEVDNVKTALYVVKQNYEYAVVLIENDVSDIYKI